MKLLSGFKSFFEDEEQKTGKINTLIDSNELIMFFTKDGVIYGTTEESRLIFAKMKDPDDKDWLEEASFAGYDLARALEGEKIEKLFYAKDIKPIKVIPREQAVKLLTAKKITKPANKLKPSHDKETGFIQIKDRQ